MNFEFSDPANQSNILTAYGLIFMPISVDDAKDLFNAVSTKAFHPDLVLSKIDTLDKAKQWCTERSKNWQTNECFVWTWLCHNYVPRSTQIHHRYRLQR